MRPFQTPFGQSFLNAYQVGTLSYRYKDFPCWKSPIDLAIYLRVLWQEKPASIIEIGSKHGGSAAFFKDMTHVMELETTVVSIDIKPPNPPPQGGARFLRGSVLELDKVFTENDLYALPRPWLVIEDSAHGFATTMAALRFFSDALEQGEMLVIEDGVLEDLGASESFGGGPNRAISRFFTEHPDTFRILYEYTDMFGINATFNPNGYLRKT